MQRRILLLVILFALLAGTLAPISLPVYGTDEPTVFVEPKNSIFSTTEKRAGDTIQINCTLANVTGLAGFAFSLSWNPTLLVCTGIQEILFHSVTPTAFWSNIWNLTLGYDNTAGTADYAQVWNDLDQAVADGYAPANITTNEYPEGKLTAAIITLKIVSEPFPGGFKDCSLDLSNVKMGDLNGEMIAHSVNNGYYKLIGDLPAQVYVDPSTITAVAGEIFNVSIYSSGALDLYAWQMNMTWDPSILSYVSLTKGDEPPPVTQAWYAGNNGTGQLVYGGVCDDPTLLVSSPVKLFTVTFNGTKGGTSPIRLVNVELFGISDHGNGWPPNTPVYQGIPEFTSYAVWPDINHDGVISIYDPLLFINHFFSFPGSPHYSASCDFNADGCVDTFDLAILTTDFGKDTSSPTWPNSTYPNGLTNTIYQFNTAAQNSSAKVLEPVDVAVTSITNVDGMIIYFRGTNRTSGTNVPINVTVARLDSNDVVPSVEVNLTLSRMNLATSENVTISNGTLLVAPGAESTMQFLWNETSLTLSVGNYEIYVFADPIGPVDIHDINLTNNIGIGGTVRVVVGIKEDLTGDGTVNIYDALKLVPVLGKTGPPGWIPEDLMQDGIVDSFDVYMIQRMFNWNMNDTSFQPSPQPWNLTISTPLGQKRNDTVVVFSDYIVYSQYSFNKTLEQLSFNITSNIDGFCNVSIPKTSMSGAFTVYLDDAPTPCVITWNATHYFVYFNTTGLSQKVRIVSEYADEILGDLNHDGIVDIYDAIILANHYGWRDP